MQELTPVDLKPNFDMETFRAMLRPLLTGKIDKLEFSTVHRRRNGTDYDVDVNLQVSTYLANAVFVAIVLDVTERRRAERRVKRQQETMQADLERLVETRTEELRKAQGELVLGEKFATLGKVSGGIAHEIRNPLNAVKTSAYYLLNAKNLAPEKIQEHLERIDRQVTMIDNVITALSDVAKLPEAFLRPVEMETVLRSVLGSVNLPSEIEVVFDLPDPLPVVLADENQIAIAFRNLVRNARDAMPQGGTLSLSADIGDELVTFNFADSGIGISEELLNSILEPLFTTKARGLGLGLSITLAIVEKNQGVLSYSSEHGKGSVFSVGLCRQNQTKTG
jgi:two-component system sensor kinase FixL